MDKILIVEDSMELSDALCRNLQVKGFPMGTVLHSAVISVRIQRFLLYCLLFVTMHRIWCGDCLSERMTM